jgi:hypothetical protein
LEPDELPNYIRDVPDVVRMTDDVQDDAQDSATLADDNLDSMDYTKNRTTKDCSNPM